MHSIHQVMSDDHKHCDDIFVEAQKYAARKDWVAAREYTDLFTRNVLLHFNHEETVLFPAFEQKTGMLHGPTEVMREEHKILRDLFDDLRQAAVKESSSDFLGVAETLFIFMQQHNMKEENVLYPMMDQKLSATELNDAYTINKMQTSAA